MARRNAVIAQHRRIADAGKLKQLRRMNASGSQNDLAVGMVPFAHAGPHDLHAGRALAVDEHTQHVRVREHFQVGPVERRGEIGVIGADPPATTIVDLIVAEAVLIAVIVVGVEGVAGGHRRIDEGPRDNGALLEHFHRQRPALSAGLPFRPLEILKALEIRQHVLMAPADAALLCPAVIIMRLAAHINHAVDEC